MIAAGIQPRWRSPRWRHYGTSVLPARNRRRWSKRPNWMRCWPARSRRPAGPCDPAQASLLEILHDAQAICGGWLPRPAVEQIAGFLAIPLADVYGVTEFYEMFHTGPVGRKVIRVCQDGPCAVQGADALMARLTERLGIGPGETTADGAYTVEPVRCLGLCDRAPAALVNLERYAPAGRGNAAGRPTCPGPATDRRAGQDRAGERRRSGPHQPRRLPRPGRHGRAEQGAARDDAGPGDRRGEGEQAGGPRRRGVFGRAEVAVRDKQPAAPFYHLQRRRKRAGRVQGSRADG